MSVMTSQVLPLAVSMFLVAVLPHFGNCLTANVAISGPQTPPTNCKSQCSEIASLLKTCGCDNEISKPNCPNSNYFPTMSRYEFLMLSNGIFRGKDRNAQNQFDVCNLKFAPPKSLDAFKMCSQKFVGATHGPQFHKRLAQEPMLALGIYECVVRSVTRLTPEEKAQIYKQQKCFEEIRTRCRNKK